MRSSIEWDFDAAEKDLLRAIELEPGHDLAHWGYAILACYRGRFDQALTEIERAQAISPGTMIYSRDRGRILYYARRYDESIAQLKQALELDNNAASVRAQLWLAYEAKGDFASALEARMTLMRMNGQNELVEQNQKAFEAGGMPAVWRIALERNKHNEDGSGTNFYGSARLCIYLGDKEQAFHYLNKTYDHRQFQMALLLVDPVLDPIRDDPRFEELVRRVGLK
jgi:tetratricopeptide (TPR) repeat protein